MAASDLTVNEKWATVECDDTVHKLTIAAAGGSLTNVGANPVFLSMSNEGDLQRDGLQNNGEIRINPDDSIPIPADAAFVRHQCAAGQTTTMWFVPRLG